MWFSIESIFSVFVGQCVWLFSYEPISCNVCSMVHDEITVIKKQPGLIGFHGVPDLLLFGSAYEIGFFNGDSQLGAAELQSPDAIATWMTR